jgi:hypothetical protein
VKLKLETKEKIGIVEWTEGFWNKLHLKRFAVENAPGLPN